MVFGRWAHERMGNRAGPHGMGKVMMVMPDPCLSLIVVVTTMRTRRLTIATKHEVSRLQSTKKRLYLNVSPASPYGSTMIRSCVRGRSGDRSLWQIQNSASALPYLKHPI